MPAPARFAALLVLCLGALGFAAPKGEDTVRSLSRELQRARDDAPAELFERLAALGSEESLDALLAAAERLRRPEALAAAYAACARYAAADAAVFRRALGRLGRIARADRRDAARLAAAGALVAIGEPALARLLDLAREANDPDVRRRVVDPLVPYLAGHEAPAEAARLVVGRASLGPAPLERYLGLAPDVAERLAGRPHREVVRDALASLEGPEVVEVLAERFADARTTRAWRLLLVELLAARGGDAATRALAAALAGEDPTLVLAALDALEGREDPGMLVEALAPLLRAGEPAIRRSALIALGERRLTDRDWPAELLDLSRSRDEATRMGAAAALAHLRTPEALARLTELLEDPSWSVRVEALHRLGDLRRKETVPLLVERFAAEEGRLREEVHAVLRLLTGLDLGEDPSRWKTWWARESESFELPPLEAARSEEARRAARPAERTRAASYYGLAVTSRRVAFVLDVSGSMRKPAAEAHGARGRDGLPPTRMDVAKHQLSAALKAFPEGELFNLIFFESEVRALAPKLVRMTKTNRARALRFVREQYALGATALYPALELAFADPLVDTIYVLTDGAPTEGEVTDIAEIRAEVGRWNGARHVVIHGIAMGEDSTLLRWLTADTGGRYVRLE